MGSGVILIRLTGLVTIESEGRAPRHLSSAQAQAAFCRLVLERNMGTSRDQLADTVWPNGLPDTWASALRSVVSRVRTFVDSAGLGDQTQLIARGGRYLLRLPDEVTVDIEHAEEMVVRAAAAHAAENFADAQRFATAAVSFLRRPFLPDHEGEWVAETRERVTELLLSGLEIASLAASALHDERAALQYADEAVKRAPLRESAHRCLMTAHVTAGNRAEALRSYHRLCRILAEELGIDPAPETQAAYVDLLGSPATSAGRARRHHKRDRAPVRFTGRRAELAALARAWESTRAGSGRLVLVTGEAGIGKTRLVTEAARRVGADGGVVMFGRCEQGAPVPYQPFAQALADFAAATPEEALPPLSPEARRLLNALAAEPQQPSKTADRLREESLWTLGELLAGVARAHPVFLVLDDLDLAAQDTLTLLQYLFRRYGLALPLMAVATTRAQVHYSDRFRAVVQDLDREGAVHRIQLRGLEEADVRVLMGQLLPEGDENAPPAHRLIADTGGNAYLLLELLRWHQENPDGADRSGAALSPGILEHAAARLAALDPAARQLLRTAAVAGPSFEFDLVAAAAGLDADRALEALDALVADQMVTEVVAGGRGLRSVQEYRFTHDVLRRAIYQQFSQAHRRSLHGKLADAIERLRAEEPGRYSRSLAHHRAAGAAPHGDRRAVHSSWRAAAGAELDGAQNEAIRLYRQALHHVPHADLDLRTDALTRLGLAQLAGGHPECEQNLLDASIQALHIGRLDLAAQALLGLADVVSERPRLRDETAVLIDILLAKAGDTSAGTAGRTIDDLSRGRLLARLQRLGKKPAPGPVTIAALRAMAQELRSLTGIDHLARRFALADEMRLVATAVGDSTARVIAAHHRAMAAEALGDMPALREALAMLAVAAEDGGQEGDVGFADALLVDHAVATATAEGRFTDAAAAGRCLLPPEDDGSHGITPVPGTLAPKQLLIARWLRGSTWPRTDRAVLDAADPVERSLAALLDGDRGMPHLTVRALAIGAQQLPPGDEWMHAAGILALCAVEVGDVATADAVRELLTPYAHLSCGMGYRSFLGPVSFHLGRLAMVAGDWDAAELHLMSALSHLSGRQARPWVALAQYELARALEARGRLGDERCAQALRSEAEWTLADLGLRHSA